jgi:DNA-binding SARP family transcriptional activator
MTALRAGRPAVIWALTWMALLAVPVLLALKIGFPVPDPIFSDGSPQWLSSPSAPVVEVAAAGAWVAWCVGVVVQVRRHRRRSVARSSSEQAAQLVPEDAAVSTVDRLRIDASHCVELLLAGPLQLGGLGARHFVPFVCAGWLAHDYASRIVIDAQLAGDLGPLGPALDDAVTFGEGRRLLRLVEGEVLGRKRHALAQGFEEDRAEIDRATLPPLLVVLADVPAGLRDAWHDVVEDSTTLGIGVLSLDPAMGISARFDVDGLSATDNAALGEITGRDGWAIGNGAKSATDDVPTRGWSAALTPALPQPAAARADVIEQAETTPLRVQVLGPYRIWAHGSEVSTGLRSASRELLAWYLLEGEGASATAAVDALWPDTDPEQVTKRFWRALGDLRSRLRSPDGSSSVAVLSKSAGLYRPSETEISCDLWEFQSSLRIAQRAEDPAVVRDQLHHALNLYRGDLFAGTDFLWAMAAATSLRRQVHDAGLRLSELERIDGRTESAVGVLERAITAEPYAEDLYRSLIALRLSMDEPELASDVLEQLAIRLREIGAEPASSTKELVPSVNRVRR